MVTYVGLPPGIQDACAIGFGAVFGAVARHQVGRAISEKIISNTGMASHSQVWHTAGINISGSFLLGVLMGLPTLNNELSTSNNATKYLQLKSSIPPGKGEESKLSVNKSMRFALSPRMKLLFGTGFCGSFTTFSTFSVDVVNLFGKGNAMKAISYVCINNMGSFAAAFSGIKLARNLTMK